MSKITLEHIINDCWIAAFK